MKSIPKKLSIVTPRPQTTRHRIVGISHLPNAQIELIEPYGDDSPIHGFLAKNPRGGQHHVCFEVENILAARDDMRAKGATVLVIDSRGERAVDVIEWEDVLGDSPRIPGLLL